MRHDDSRELRERIEAVTHRKVGRPVVIIDNAQSYSAIQPGMVFRIAGADYYVLGEAKEGRFGIDEQPKLWVKYAIDLSDGARKIIKLPFFEQVERRIGRVTVRRVRDPDKESRVLELVADDSRFMQGHTAYDPLGNNIRIIDLIRGRSLYILFEELDQPHEEYFRETMPGLLQHLLESLEALASVHDRGEQHGDVRCDHLMVDSANGRFRWIDFDYSANFRDYDLWAVGNVLTYVVGGGTYTCEEAQKMLDRAGSGGRIHGGDALLLLPFRLANLRKIFPYIPEALQKILLRFARDTREFYEDLHQILRELREVVVRL